jgi:hypothetical protein
VSDVFEEVEENLRHEQYAGWFQRYGLWAGLALVVLLAGVGGWQGYRAWSANQAALYSQKIEDGKKLFETRDFAGADRYYGDLAKSAPGIYKTMALQLDSEALYQQGDAKGALARLDKAAGSAPSKLVRDSVKLKAAYIASDLQDYKTLAPRLNALIEGGGPLSYLAREALGAKAYEAGDMAHAREQYNFLSLALEAPEGVRQRARSALALMGPEAGAKPGAAK